MTSGKQPDRSFGAAVAVALLALAPSVQAAIGQSSCVRIATAARSSSCVPGANIESFAFSMEGTTGAAAYDAVSVSGGVHQLCDECACLAAVRLKQIAHNS